MLGLIVDMHISIYAILCHKASTARFKKKKLLYLRHSKRKLINNFLAFTYTPHYLMLLAQS